MNKIAWLCSLLCLSCLTPNVSHSTVAGFDISSNSPCGFGKPTHLYETSNSDNIYGIIDNPSFTVAASASLNGYLTSKSTLYTLYGATEAISKSWIEEAVYNNSATVKSYFLSIDYIFDLVPANYNHGGDDLAVAGANGYINILKNNIALKEITYNNRVSYAGDLDFEFSIPSYQVGSDNIFLGQLGPLESFTLTYSIGTMATSCGEHFSSSASGVLETSLLSIPVATPEPSTFLLLSAGIAGAILLKRKMKG